jgi:uncharacterized protein (TIGR03435 family)
MMRRSMCVPILAIFAAASTATAQTNELPSFEVASIRPSPEGPPAAGAAGVHITKEQVHFAYLSLRDYLSIAFTIPIQRISAPEWINSTRFDIGATFPGGATPEQFPKMIESLLRTRFKLQAHMESKESPVFTLEVASSGSKLVRVPDDAPSDAPFSVTSSGGTDGVTADLGNGASLVFNNKQFEARKVTMRILVETLSRFMDRPILDLTKLEGRFNVTFAMAQEDYMPMLVRSAVNAGITLPPQAMALLDAPSIGSVESGLKSLGLVLEARRAPLDLLVVDSIEKAPTEN